MNFSSLKNEKGFALVSVYLVSMVIMALSASTYTRTFIESREVGREINRLQIRSAAESGLQRALAQISFNALTGGIAYTGFINTAPIPSTNLNNYNGTNVVGNFSVNITYPNQADWVVVNATGTAPQGESPIILEARVFLDSNFSKYMMYANTPNLGLGDNLLLGASDGTNPEGVPTNGTDRNMLYYTGDLTFSGSNVNIYGDTHTQGLINGNASSWNHGDTYAGGFTTNSFGQVTNSGVSGGLRVGDGFSDDTDRNGEGTVNALDYPDYHASTANGGGDSHKTETINPLNLNFSASQAQSIPGIDGIDVARYGGGNPRYFKFEPSSSGNTTRIVEYSSPSYQTQTGSRDLQSKNGIVYVNGNVFVQGEITGRVTVVSSNDIYYADNIKYAGGNSYTSASNAASFMAKNKHYFLPESLEVSGILYGERATSSSTALDATYKRGNALNNYKPIYDAGASKLNGHFRQYGNIVMNGTANTSVYRFDRAFMYDANAKYYRPPGLPVQPVLRLVREA